MLMRLSIAGLDIVGYDNRACLGPSCLLPFICLRLAGELLDHRGRTRFAGEGERVFCHPLTGGALDHKRYAGTFKAVLEKADVRGDVRPFHDMRHTSITNAAAAGTPPAALMARAGHSDFKTTQGYIDLAGETFREEADRLEERVFASLSTHRPGS
jgi:integrase